MENYKHKVNYYETDKMGITHHSNYIRFFEEARVYFLEQIGWGFDKIEEMGIVSPVVNVSCNYKHTCTFADDLEIKVEVQKVTAAKLVLEYTITCKDKVICTGESSHCFTKEGRPLIIEKVLPEFYATLLKYVKQ